MSDRRLDVPHVLVVVVNYRSSEYLRRLLASVLAEPEVAAVVVHDNGSGPAEWGRVQEIQRDLPAVTFVDGGVNLGFGAGVNQAVRESPVDDWTHVWVVNPDAEVRSGALGRLLAAAAAHDCAIVSPLIVGVSPGGDETVWVGGGSLDLDRGRSTHDGIGRPASEAPTAFLEVSFVTGAAPLIRRDAWDALGGFDERFFLYWEDADLSLRATRAGYRLGVEPLAVVAHWQGGSSGGGASPVYCYYIQRNRLWLVGGLGARLRVAFLRGRRTTRNHLIFAVRRSAHPVRSGWASVRGLGAGLIGPGWRR